MTIKDLGNGLVKLTYKTGIIDTRNRAVHSEVICKRSEIKYFVENN